MQPRQRRMRRRGRGSCTRWARNAWTGWPWPWAATRWLPWCVGFRGQTCGCVAVGGGTLPPLAFGLIRAKLWDCVAAGGGTLAPLVCGLQCQPCGCAIVWLLARACLLWVLTGVGSLRVVQCSRSCSGQVEGQLADERQVPEGGSLAGGKAGLISWGHTSRPSTRH